MTDMHTTSENQPPAPGPGGRGGRRPGAGGKPGNLNALKHGRRSAQFAQLGLLLASMPETRQALLGLARRHHLKERKAEQVAARLLNAMMERARATAERRTINESGGQTGGSQLPHTPSKSSSTAKPSNRQSGPARAIKD